MKKNVSFLLVFVIFCLLITQVNGQQMLAGITQTDTLQKQIAKHADDTVKVDLLNQLAFEYNKINPYNGIKYATQSLALAKKLQWKPGMARANSCLGANYYSLSDFANAYNYWLTALEINKTLGNVKGIANHLVNIGNIYYSEKDYTKALEYYEEGLKSSLEIGNENITTNSYSAIGNVYTQLKNYPKALEYHSKALAIDEKNNLKGNIAGDEINIGSVYNEQGNNKKALDVLFRALRIKMEIGDRNGSAKTYTLIGKVFQDIAKQGSAGNGFFGNVKNDLQHAITYLDSAVSISMEIGYLDNLQKSYQYLSEAYDLNGDYKKALYYANNFRITKDSVFSRENNEQIVKQGLRLEFEHARAMDSLKSIEKDNISKMKLQRQQSYTYIGLAGVVLLLGFSFFIVKERRKSEKLLLNILPSEVADELKSKGVTKARHFDNVTVLFTDFVNFTKTSESMDPQVLIDELHSCFKAFDEIMGRYNIEKIKTIGDAYLAAGGLPVADPKHAENIVKAAIDMNRFMQDRLATMGDKTFAMRIGIHTGSVVAGVVGVRKFAYDIWGDTVNTAARMESSSKAGKINISQSTYELVKDKFTCEYRGEVEAKSKGMMKMYFVE